MDAEDGSAVPVARVDLVVDVANVVGSRPDGWWRDRAAAAARLLGPLGRLERAEVSGPDGVPLVTGRVFAVVEGQARHVSEPSGVTVVRAPADGDEAVVRLCADLVRDGASPLVVTADRGLRARLPSGAAVAGPRWLRDLLDHLTQG